MSIFTLLVDGFINSLIYLATFWQESVPVPVPVQLEVEVVRWA